jgi:predicted AAA+ superfamily ATPase
MEYQSIEEYSFWREPPSAQTLGTIRNSYLEKLEGFSKSNAFITVSGARRAGKSVLLRQFISRMQSIVPAKNILYLNYFLRAFQIFRNEEKLYQLLSWWRNQIDHEKQSFLILDEIQELENWEAIVADLAEDYQNRHKIIISGSNASLLGAELSSNLSGRYFTLTVHPFTYLEFCDANNISALDRTSVTSFISRGALPEPALLESQMSRENLYNSIVYSTIQKDIIERYNPNNPVLIGSLIEYYSANYGCRVSLPNILNSINTKIKKKEQVALETIEKYTYYLAQVYFLYSCSVFSYRKKALLERGPHKYYVNDWGLAASSPSIDRGRLLENIVFMELIKYGYAVSTYLAYNGENREVDFIAKKKNITLYLQVVWSLESLETNKNLYEREVGNLLAVKSSGEKIILTFDEVPPRLDVEGIAIVTPQEFFVRLVSAG